RFHRRAPEHHAVLRSALILPARPGTLRVRSESPFGHARLHAALHRDPERHERAVRLVLPRRRVLPHDLPGIRRQPGLDLRLARLGGPAACSNQPLTPAGTDEGGPLFTHTLPGGACGAVTQWYYTVPLPDGSTATAPAGGAAAPYEASARTPTPVFSDDFEID